jgi:hypothetical protein
MHKQSPWLSVALLALFPLVTGCGYAIQYRLTEKTITKVSAPIPLNVQVAVLTDQRDAIEKNKSERKRQGYPDASDYSYDKNFRGNVAASISKRMVEHLQYAAVFAKIELAPFTVDSVDSAILTQAAQAGYDAVLTGEIQHFSGYYNYDVGRQILYGLGLGLGIGIPVTLSSYDRDDLNSGYSVEGSIATSLGVTLGFYLESLHKRDIEKHTKLAMRLVSTRSYQEMWQDEIEIHQKENKSMPGLSSTRQMELAVHSLRDAINEMVRRLSQANLVTHK